jgi:hypothetical protein
MKSSKLRMAPGALLAGLAKLKGIKGKGTYKGEPDAAGNVVYDICGRIRNSQITLKRMRGTAGGRKRKRERLPLSFLSLEKP